MEIIGEDEEEVRLRVAAGEDWDGLVEYCVGDKAGVGWKTSPGYRDVSGSSPIQNIGAYGPS